LFAHSVQFSISMSYWVTHWLAANGSSDLIPVFIPESAALIYMNANEHAITKRENAITKREIICTAIIARHTVGTGISGVQYSIWVWPSLFGPEKYALLMTAEMHGCSYNPLRRCQSSGVRISYLISSSDMLRVPQQIV